MNWEAISAIGQVVGAFAVVVSLLYLALQIRSQNKEARIAAMHDISAGYRDMLATIAGREFMEVLDKAFDDYDGLTRGESIRLIAALLRVLKVWEEAFFQYEAGRLDQRVWEPMERQFNAYMSTIPFTRVWEIRKNAFDTEFQSYVESGERREYKHR